MPSQPRPDKTARAARAYERAQAKDRVVQAYNEGRDWHGVAKANDVKYDTARRAVIAANETPKRHGGLRSASVKMTVEVMCKLEEYLDEDCRQTLEQLRDRLLSDMGVPVSMSSVHRALQGMLYPIKTLRIEKITMNSTENKTKRKNFVLALNAHIDNGDMIVYHDETNFNLYLSRTVGRSRVGDRATVALPPSKGQNLHVQGGVSAGSGLVLLKTHDGSIKKEENARFIADLFMAALSSEEFRELESSQKVVIVTDNVPAHSCAEELARRMLAEDGILNLGRLVVLRLGPYSPMLNPIEGCWNSLKAKMKRFLVDKKHEMMVRGEYDTYIAHRMAILAEAVEASKNVITRYLVQRFERHSLHHCFAAERGEDMRLGK